MSEVHDGTQRTQATARAVERHLTDPQDDHLLGFIGPKNEAEQVKARLTAFLRDDLKVELNQDKTLITHARTGAARFLGYEITVYHADHMITNDQRTVNGKIGLRVPLTVIKSQCAPFLTRGKPAHRPEWINRDDHDIVATYGAKYRGHRQVLPARRRCLETEPAGMGHEDLDAENDGGQAPVHRVQDGGPASGQSLHRTRTADLL